MQCIVHYSIERTRKLSKTSNNKEAEIPTSVPDRGHTPRTSTNMADPFEVRMKFTAMVQNMNASVTSAQKAANYAMRYKDMDEDLHSCILEQVEKVDCIVALSVENVTNNSS